MVCPPLIGQDFIPLMKGGRVRGIGTGAILRQRTGPSRRDLKRGGAAMPPLGRSCWGSIVVRDGAGGGGVVLVLKGPYKL